MSQFKGEKDYQHGSQEKIGILITNLGTPDAPNTKALKVYLKEFLSDPRVIEVPKIIWQIILRMVILQTRPRKSAKSYKSIWTEKGSPLLEISKKQLNAIKSELELNSKNIIVELGMRYGNPSIQNGLEVLQKKQCRKLLVLPLYPQYCGATTGSTFDAISSVLLIWRWIPEIRFINKLTGLLPDLLK